MIDPQSKKLCRRCDTRKVRDGGFYRNSTGIWRTYCIECEKDESGGRRRDATKTQKMSVHFPVADLAAVHELAGTRGVTAMTVVRAAVAAYLRTHAREVDGHYRNRRTADGN